MDIYKFVCVNQEGYHVVTTSTDMQDLEILLQEFQKIFPPTKVWKSNLPDGSIYSYDISVKDSAPGAKWWVIKQLLLNGYEPLGLPKKPHLPCLRLLSIILGAKIR